MKACCQLNKFTVFLFILLCGYHSIADAAKPALIDGTFRLRSQHEILDAKIKSRVATDPLYVSQLKSMGRVSPQMVVSQTVTDFQVYNFSSGGYERRTGRLQAIGNYCYIFVEDSSLSLISGDSATTINQIKSTFDEKIYTNITDWFGTVTVPSSFSLPDNKIYILLLDIRDGLSGGYVAGYFDSRDLEGVYGNQKPVFFMDLNPGTPGIPTDKNNDFYKTLAHEFQHMINFSKHLGLGGVQEERWVEEGLSGFSEYLYTMTVDNDGIGLAPTPHLSRFLENPDIVLTSNSDTEWFQEATLYRHYGASFLFFYYLQEKMGGQTDQERKVFVRSLLNNPSVGINGINSVLSSHATSFIECLKNWMLANHLNDPSLNNGLWGYTDKATRLGDEGTGIPIKGGSHNYSASGLSFVGGEGRVHANAGKYEDISGSGNLTLFFKGESQKQTPFVATVDFANQTTLQNIVLTSSLTGSIDLDLSKYKMTVLVPAVTTTLSDLSDIFYYQFSGKTSKVVLYPIPNPAFSNEFIIVVKSTAGALSTTPTVQVTFNNIQTNVAMTSADSSSTLFVGNYTIPGAGQGIVTAGIDSETSTFSFFSAALRANTITKLQIKDAEFSISSRIESDNAFLYETTLSEIPSELQILSKPYYAVFNNENAIEARLLFENISIPTDQEGKLGLWSGKTTDSSWLKTSRNERGLFSSIAKEGLYVLVSDSIAPKIHDLHIEEKDAIPTLLGRISDDGSGINHDSIRVEVDSESVPFTFESVNGVITADLSRLSKGEHRISVEALDQAENKGRVYLIQTLLGPLLVSQTTAYPNPSRGSTNLAVILEGNGSDDPTLDVEVKIYDSSGSRVNTLPLTYKSNRTFTTRWDLRNESGRLVANGVYPFKVFIRKGGEEYKASGKLAVLN